MIRYMKKDFYLDLISFIIFFLWINNCNKNEILDYLISFYFIKLLKIKQIFKNFEELLVTDENYFHIFSLFILLIRIFVVTHLAACIWYYIGNAYSLPDNSWLVSKNLMNKPLKIKYLYSFYYIIITMNTVGYGDIIPQNSAEMLFCIVFVVIGCMMFAYCLNCMGTIFHALYKKDRELKEELFLINDFMKSKNISQKFQMRIRKYLQQVWVAEKQSNLDNSKKVFNKLSQSLQSELLKEAYGSIVNKIDLLSLNFSPLILDELIKTMKEENYPPGETIFKKGEYKNKDLFFIKKGVVEIFVENEIIEKDNKIILQQLNEGSIFGEIAFFSDMMRTASVKSKEYTTLIRFNQNEFKKLIEESNEDKEKYNYIRDQINLYHNYDDLFLKCYSCNQRNHLITECPLIHRKILSEFVLAKYNYSENQKRNIIKRTLKKHKFIIESQVNKFETIKSIFIKESELFEDNSELVDNSESNIIRDMSQNREFTFESIEESSNKHDFKSNLTSSYECISSLNKRKSEKEIKSSKNLSKIKIITLEGKNTHYFFIYLFANILRNQ